MKISIIMLFCYFMKGFVKKSKRLFWRAINPLVNRVRFQNFFELLQLGALMGMNMVGGDDPRSSGEINAIKYSLGKLKSQKPLIFFDVGANIGDYTKIIAELLENKNAAIYAFEPSKITFSKLEFNLKNIQKVFAYNFGFGKENKKMALFYPSEGAGLASLYKRRLDHFNILMNLSENVEIKTIDSFCLENGINYINFLKLDVEGHEFDILRGAKRMIEAGAIDFIQFEFGGCNIDSRTFFQDFYYLLSPNYKIYRIVGNGLHPINRYKETQEIFTIANYFAEKKYFLA